MSRSPSPARAHAAGASLPPVSGAERAIYAVERASLALFAAVFFAVVWVMSRLCPEVVA